MALEIIGAGYGRTGTMSLKLALERLGFAKCYHTRGVVSGREDHSQHARPRQLVHECDEHDLPVVDVPDEPYPRVNTTDDFMNRIAQLSDQQPSG